MRKEGYYWIKMGNRDTDWTVGYYSRGYWKIIGNNYDYTDYDLKEINEVEIKK